MTTAQEQYTEIVKQGQDAVRTAVDTWTRTVQDTFAKLPTTAPVDADQVIDQVFDFADKMLGAQRDFAKHLVKTTNGALDNARQGAEQLAEQVTDNGHQG
jgi:hypothetical protein